MNIFFLHMTKFLNSHAQFIFYIKKNFYFYHVFYLKKIEKILELVKVYRN
jgi:hypothetical protein